MNSVHRKLGLGVAAVLTMTVLGFIPTMAIDAPRVASSDASVIPEEPVVDLNQGGAPPMLYTQDFQLQDCTLGPRGVNPFFDPLVPGFFSVLENPNKTDDAGNPVTFLKELRVISETEPFDLEGIGSFEAAVIEETEIEDGKVIQTSVNWFAICEETNSVFAVGENSFTIDPDTQQVLDTEGTWRAGEINEQGEIAIPSMAMPGTFLLGSKFIFDGAPGVAFGGAETVAQGLKTTDGRLSTVPTANGYPGEDDVPIPITAAAGDFRGCGQIEEISQFNDTRLPDLTDLTNKVWCPGVGLVYDTSDGALVHSNALTDGEFREELERFQEEEREEAERNHAE